jgi:hypothetical protein
MLPSIQKNLSEVLSSFLTLQPLVNDVLQQAKTKNVKGDAFVTSQLPQEIKNNKLPFEINMEFLKPSPQESLKKIHTLLLQT